MCPRLETSWGSRPAHEMFWIAVYLAGFDATALMLEIHRRSPHGGKVKESTVLAAMQVLADSAC